MKKFTYILASFFVALSVSTTARADLIVEPPPSSPFPTDGKLFGTVDVLVLIIVVVIVAVVLLRKFRKK